MKRYGQRQFQVQIDGPLAGPASSFVVLGGRGGSLGAYHGAKVDNTKDACSDVIPDWVPGRDDLVRTCRSTIEAPLQALANQANNALTSMTHERDVLRDQLAQVGNDVSAFVAQRIGTQGGRLFDATAQMLSWLTDTAGRMSGVLSTSTSIDQKLALFSQLDPGYQDSSVYHLFMDPQYEAAADAVAVLIFYGQLANPSNWGPALLLVSNNPSILAVQASNLTLQPTPYLTLLRDAVRILHEKPTGMELLRQLATFAGDFIFMFYGVGLSVPTAIQLAVCVIGGLPNPNPVLVAPLIANDPIFRHDMKVRLNVFVPEPAVDLVVDKGMPAIAQCMQVSDADGFLRCAEKVIDATLPGFVRQLRRRGVSLDDARVVVTALWRANGNFEIAFDASTHEGELACTALAALGVGGVICLAELVGERQIVSWFENHFGTIIPQNTFKNIQKALHLVVLCMKVFNQYRDDDITHEIDTPGPRLRILLQAGNATTWNLNNTLALARINGAFDGLHVTPELVQLLNLLYTWWVSEGGSEKVMHLFCDLFALADLHPPFCETAHQSLQPTAPGNTLVQTQPSSGGLWLLLAAAAAAGAAAL